MDRGAWWAAVYAVAQSRTRLKRLSSSSSSMYCLLYISNILKNCYLYKKFRDFPSYLYWDTAYLAKKKKRLLSDLLFSGYDEQLASGYSLVI